MPIETATPEQVKACVMGLKRHIDKLEAEGRRKDAEIERLQEALEDVKEDPYLAELWIDGVRAALQESTE